MYVFTCVMIVIHTNYNLVNSTKPLKTFEVIIAAFHCCSLHLDSRFLFSLKSSVLGVLLFLSRNKHTFFLYWLSTAGRILLPYHRNILSNSQEWDVLNHKQMVFISYGCFKQTNKHYSNILYCTFQITVPKFGPI